MQTFLQQRIGENLTLDYKRELSTSSDSDRAELCKDVSALANSQGGMIIYGVDEDSTDRTPQLPPVGTPRTVGRQSVEEWASQVLRSGVQPPLDFEMDTFDYGAARIGACWWCVQTPALPPRTWLRLRGPTATMGGFIAGATTKTGSPRSMR